MRLKDSYTLMEFRGNYLLVCNGRGGTSASLDKGIQVNGSFAFLWKKFSGTEFSISDVVEAFLSEYDITREEAIQAASDIVSLWREKDMLQA